MTVSAKGEKEVRIKGSVHLRWNAFYDLLEPGSGLCVEVGCGGSVVNRASVERLGYRYLGLDIRPSKGLNAIGDAHMLPFADESIDVLISAQVMEHLEDPVEASREVGRVLKRGGVFCGSTSLLEPFHHSYFNFTHWGIRKLLLDDAGLRDLRIESGPNVALFVVYYLFDMLGLLQVGKWLSRPTAVVLFGFPLLLVRALHTAKAGIKWIIGRGGNDEARALWSVHALSWCGYFLFRAKKEV